MPLVALPTMPAGKKGPLNAGLAHSRRLQEADSREARAIGMPLIPDDLDKLPAAAAAVVTVAGRPAPAPPAHTRETSTARSLSFSTAMDPEPTEASTPGVVRPTGGQQESAGNSRESGNREQKGACANSEEQHHEDEVLGPEAREEQVVVLFQRDRAPHPAAARRAEASQASSGASSTSPGAVSRGSEYRYWNPTSSTNNLSAGALHCPSCAYATRLTCPDAHDQ